MTRANRRLPAAFWRGGTSKAVIFRRDHLPEDQAEWDAIFLAVMGSPDPYGRQLDGMGGGISSLSKICIVGPSARNDADVDYTFVQISTKDALVDYGGNCGNMSAAIGPYALREGLVSETPDIISNNNIVVRIHNTNTGKLIHSHFPVENGELAADGNLAIDGVAGTAAPVRLEFIEPGGAKTGKLLPTGNARDTLTLQNASNSISASCVDAANPCIFVTARDLGKNGCESPLDLDNDKEFLQLMEQIRQAGSVAMGLTSSIQEARNLVSIPKVAIVSGTQDSRTLTGQILAADDMDICVRMISAGQPHRAIPVTGAICVAIAARVPGSVVAQVIQEKACKENALTGSRGEISTSGDKVTTGALRIGHASGVSLVDAVVTENGGNYKGEFGAVYRSARELFSGFVNYRA